MADGVATTGEAGVQGLPDVLPDSRAQDEAYQQLERERMEQVRLSARLGAAGGRMEAGGEAPEARELPEFAGPASRQALSASRTAASQAVSAVQQAEQVAAVARAAGGAARAGSVIAGVAAFLAANLPLIIGITIGTFAIWLAGSCAAHKGLCAGAVAETVWEPIAGFFRGKDSTASPAADTATAGGATSPASLSGATAQP